MRILNIGSYSRDGYYYGITTRTDTDGDHIYPRRAVKEKEIKKLPPKKRISWKDTIFQPDLNKLENDK